jgi:hypothetical protein
MGNCLTYQSKKRKEIKEPDSLGSTLWIAAMDVVCD